MEDLRQQIQDQFITTVGDNSLWTICIDKDNLFNEVSTRSLYFVKTKTEQPVTSDANVILDDDRNLYNRYLETAIADLMFLLARRIPQSKREYPELFKWEEGQDAKVVDNCMYCLKFSLLMSANHDSNLLNTLINASKEFLICKVLEQWYGIPFGSEQNEKRIVHTLQYRRKSVMRKVRPLL